MCGAPRGWMSSRDYAEACGKRDSPSPPPRMLIYRCRQCHEEHSHTGVVQYYRAPTLGLGQGEVFDELYGAGSFKAGQRWASPPYRGCLRIRPRFRSSKAADVKCLTVAQCEALKLARVLVKLPPPRELSRWYSHSQGVRACVKVFTSYALAVPRVQREHQSLLTRRSHWRRAEELAALNEGVAPAQELHRGKRVSDPMYKLYRDQQVKRKRRQVYDAPTIKRQRLAVENELTSFKARMRWRWVIDTVMRKRAQFRFNLTVYCVNMAVRKRTELLNRFARHFRHSLQRHLERARASILKRKLERKKHEARMRHAADELRDRQRKADSCQKCGHPVLERSDNSGKSWKAFKRHNVFY